MKKLPPTFAFTSLCIGLLLVFISCGDINQGQLSGGQSRISSLALEWPDGYQYDPATARLRGPGVYGDDDTGAYRATPSYVTSITVTITGGGSKKVYNVSLESAEIEDSFQPGQYTISVVVETSIGLTFTGSTTVNIVSGPNNDISINLKVDAPPTSESISVSNSRPYKNQSITISISVTDLDEGDVFSYSWSASGGSVSGSGNSATWSSDKSGSYSVTVTVDDGRGGVMAKTAAITVVNRNPVISSVSVDNKKPGVGDTITATCSATDPDDDPLTFSWQDGASGTTLQHTVTSSDSFTMKCTVSDGDGGQASKSVTINGVVTIPTAPTGVSASGGSSKVTVSWGAVTDATSYNIYWDTSPGVTTASNKITGVSSSYAHTGRTNGTSYYYVVTAVNSAGESSTSSEVNSKAGILLAGLFADGALQTCINGAGKTYASEMTTDFLVCATMGIANLSGMEYLTNLTRASFIDNNITDVSYLSSMTSLQTLYLNNNSITSVSDLASMTNLTTLFLESNNISDVSQLSGLTSLQYLRLNDNSITTGVDTLAAVTWTGPINFWFQNNPTIPCADLTALRVTITGAGGSFLPTTSISGTDCT
ncbi:hypothetical protein MNBD_NITROSPINAE04-2391 [hydrothermal vent metagenome]|uniref:Chitinase n=1 Tax=hydrothermal vent metagenome TaxID=652676 RepID=A0A3B1CEC9_9ZZZZ